MAWGLRSALLWLVPGALLFWLGAFMERLGAAPLRLAPLRPPPAAPLPEPCFRGAASGGGGGGAEGEGPPLPAVQWRRGGGAPPYSAPALHYKGFFARLMRWGFFPRVILDVGANEGAWAQEVFTEILSQNQGLPTILCVEASPRREEALMRLGFDFVLSVVGPREGWTPFYDNEGWAHTGNSVLKERTGFFAGTRPTRVPMRTLDGLVEALQQQLQLRGGPATPPPSLLKLDVQGFELAALRGANRTLASVEVVILETSLLQYNEGSPLAAEVIAALDCLGYQPLEVLETHSVGPESVMLQADYAFVRKGSPLIQKATAGAGITLQ
jgi:FkbM family methyltransferase